MDKSDEIIASDCSEIVKINLTDTGLKSDYNMTSESKLIKNPKIKRTLDCDGLSSHSTPNTSECTEKSSSSVSVDESIDNVKTNSLCQNLEQGSDISTKESSSLNNICSELNDSQNENSSSKLNDGENNESPSSASKMMTRRTRSRRRAMFLSSAERLRRKLNKSCISSPKDDISRLSRDLSACKSNTSISSLKEKHHAELFRKDLISAMKLPDTEVLQPDDYFEISDTWKLEWEKGVQVPLAPDDIADANVVVIENYTECDFSLPVDKFIHEEENESYSADIHYLDDSSQRSALVCRYDLDDLDTHWLRQYNELRESLNEAPLPESSLERLLAELESSCAEHLQTAARTVEGLGIEYDENVVCDVCRCPDGSEGNEMVFCDSCDVCVHQACYGITKVPDGAWLCRPCALDVSRPRCELCPRVGGAMKVISGSLGAGAASRSGPRGKAAGKGGVRGKAAGKGGNGGSTGAFNRSCDSTSLEKGGTNGKNANGSPVYWAHINCAWWIPEVSFSCMTRMEPIVNVSQIPSSRWALVCTVCRERVGACIQCAFKTCKTSFHVSCAYERGLSMSDIPFSWEEKTEQIRLLAYCSKHSDSMEGDTADSENEADETCNKDQVKCGKKSSEENMSADTPSTDHATLTSQGSKESTCTEGRADVVCKTELFSKVSENRSDKSIEKSKSSFEKENESSGSATPEEIDAINEMKSNEEGQLKKLHVVSHVAESCCGTDLTSQSSNDPSASQDNVVGAKQNEIPSSATEKNDEEKTSSQNDSNSLNSQPSLAVNSLDNSSSQVQSDSSKEVSDSALDHISVSCDIESSKNQNSRDKSIKDFDDSSDTTTKERNKLNDESQNDATHIITDENTKKSIENKKKVESSVEAESTLQTGDQLNNQSNSDSKLSKPVDKVKPDGIKSRSKMSKGSSEQNRSLERDVKSMENMSEEEKRELRSYKLKRLAEEFYEHVQPKEIAERLHIEEDTVDFVFCYWVLKRRSSYNKPLLTSKTEEGDLLMRPNQQEEDSQIARMKMFIHLRQDLERVRNLCYMVNKRERLRSLVYRMKEDVFCAQLAVLDPTSQFSVPPDTDPLNITIEGLSSTSGAVEIKNESIELTNLKSVSSTRECNDSIIDKELSQSLSGGGVSENSKNEDSVTKVDSEQNVVNVDNQKINAEDRVLYFGHKLTNTIYDDPDGILRAAKLMDIMGGPKTARFYHNIEFLKQQRRRKLKNMEKDRLRNALMKRRGMQKLDDGREKKKEDEGLDSLSRVGLRRAHRRKDDNEEKSESDGESSKRKDRGRKSLSDLIRERRLSRFELRNRRSLDLQASRKLKQLTGEEVKDNSENRDDSHDRLRHRSSHQENKESAQYSLRGKRLVDDKRKNNRSDELRHDDSDSSSVAEERGTKRLSAVESAIERKKRVLTSSRKNLSNIKSNRSYDSDDDFEPTKNSSSSFLDKRSRFMSDRKRLLHGSKELDLDSRHKIRRHKDMEQMEESNHKVIKVRGLKSGVSFRGGRFMSSACRGDRNGDGVNAKPDVPPMSRLHTVTSSGVHAVSTGVQSGNSVKRIAPPQPVVNKKPKSSFEELLAQGDNWLPVRDKNSKKTDEKLSQQTEQVSTKEGSVEEELEVSEECKTEDLNLVSEEERQQKTIEKVRGSITNLREKFGKMFALKRDSPSENTKTVASSLDLLDVSNSSDSQNFISSREQSKTVESSAPSKSIENNIKTENNYKNLSPSFNENSISSKTLLKIKSFNENFKETLRNAGLSNGISPAQLIVHEDIRKKINLGLSNLARISRMSFDNHIELLKTSAATQGLKFVLLEEDFSSTKQKKSVPYTRDIRKYDIDDKTVKHDIAVKQTVKHSVKDRPDDAASLSEEENVGESRRPSRRCRPQGSYQQRVSSRMPDFVTMNSSSSDNDQELNQESSSDNATKKKRRNREEASRDRKRSWQARAHRKSVDTSDDDDYIPSGRSEYSSLSDRESLSSLDY